MSTTSKIPASKKNKNPKIPFVEKTESRGVVDIKVPWLGGNFEIEFPGTNRSVMIVVVAMFAMMTFVLPMCCYIIFVGAEAENLERFGNIISRRDRSDARKPEQVPVQTADGIEIIEVCPPCFEDEVECPECPFCQPPIPCFCPQPESVPDAGAW